MLSFEDCVALSALTEEEVAAIAEHEHLPMIVAAELGNYLTQTPEGRQRIKSMIREDIAASGARGDLLHALALKLVLRHYLDSHLAPGDAAEAAAPEDELVRRILSRTPPRCA